jgi:hypothetical protein
LILGFFVESVDRAVEQAVAAGGSVLSPAATWPYGRRAAVRDPDGNRIELSEDPFGRPTGGMPIWTAAAAVVHNQTTMNPL